MMYKFVVQYIYIQCYYRYMYIYTYIHEKCTRTVAKKLCQRSASKLENSRKLFYRYMSS
jgi:hypothetical protein